MNRRILATIASLMLVFTFSGSIAVETASAAYSGACITGTQLPPGSSYQRYATFTHKVGPSEQADWNGAYAQAVARDLHPCAAGFGATGVGVALVMVANLQRTSGFGPLVQIGIGECSPYGSLLEDYRCFAGNGDGGVAPDSSPYFVWTPDDASNGVLGVFTWFHNGRPIIGHTYGFYIERQTGKWQYCITDFTPNPDVQVCHADSTPTWTAGSTVWFGGETQNSNDEMGVCSGCGGFSISDMEYHKSSWSASLTGSGFCNGTSGGPSYYHCLWGPSTVLDPYTDNH